MNEEDGVFDILHTTRAMRRLKSDPIPEHLVQKILKAAVAAPCGGNRQNWGFIVVRDPSIKRQIQILYQKAFDEVVGPRYASSEPPPGVTKDQYQRQHKAVAYLTEHFHEAPVWIVACLDFRPSEGPTQGILKPNHTSGASIYPAVQNILLAARALGLGATLTTRHSRHGDQADEILHLPNGVYSYAIIPIGFPMGQFGPVRRSLSGVVYDDTWDQPRK